MKNQNRIGILLLLVSICLLIGSYGMYEVLAPSVENNDLIVLISGILLMLSVFLLAMSVFKTPKIAFLPFVFALFWFTCQIPYATGRKIVISPPPKWTTSQFGWPLKNREIVVHTVGRVVVERKTEIFWIESIMNFVLCAFLGAALIIMKLLFDRINKKS